MNDGSGITGVLCISISLSKCVKCVHCASVEKLREVASNVTLRYNGVRLVFGPGYR